MRAPVEGGAAEVVAGPLVASGLFGDGKDLYISDAKTSCLYKLDGASGAIAAVAKAGLVEDMIFDDQYLYTGAFSGMIGRIKR